MTAPAERPKAWRRGIGRIQPNGIMRAFLTVSDAQARTRRARERRQQRKPAK